LTPLPAEISVRELERMRAANAAFVLLDVREDFELEIASLAFAKHVPLGSLVERRAEIPADADVVVMCHSGVRSDHAARFLRGSGYASVANLAGGIDAWSREVDPTVPTY
jgi:adenylyltransferase/sulfurtransferase